MHDPDMLSVSYVQGGWINEAKIQSCNSKLCIHYEASKEWI